MRANVRSSQQWLSSIFSCGLFGISCSAVSKAKREPKLNCFNVEFACLELFIIVDSQKIEIRKEKPKDFNLNNNFNNVIGESDE